MTHQAGSLRPTHILVIIGISMITQRLLRFRPHYTKECIARPYWLIVVFSEEVLANEILPVLNNRGSGFRTFNTL